MRLKLNTFRLAKCASAVMLAGTTLLAGSAAAQCTLVSPPLAFEPSPPGAARPWNLYGGHNSDLQVYSSGASNYNTTKLAALGLSQRPLRVVDC